MKRIDRQTDMISHQEFGLFTSGKERTKTRPVLSNYGYKYTNGTQQVTAPRECMFCDNPNVKMELKQSFVCRKAWSNRNGLDLYSASGEFESRSDHRLSCSVSWVPQSL
jgi:hypothetical protein